MVCLKVYYRAFYRAERQAWRHKKGLLDWIGQWWYTSAYVKTTAGHLVSDFHFNLLRSKKSYSRHSKGSNEFWGDWIDQNWLSQRCEPLVLLCREGKKLRDVLCILNNPAIQGQRKLVEHLGKTDLHINLWKYHCVGQRSGLPQRDRLLLDVQQRNKDQQGLNQEPIVPSWQPAELGQAEIAPIVESSL